LIDVSSPTWAAVKAYCEEELKTARGQLESEHTTADDTVRLRARIKALTGLLALADPQPVIPSERNYT
jgi:hypothetical protein